MWADFLSHFAEISQQELEQEKKLFQAAQLESRDGGSGGTGRIE
jgi:hypothetical protein